MGKKTSHQKENVHVYKPILFHIQKTGMWI